MITCKRLGVEPYAYLYDILRRLPSHPNKGIYPGLNEATWALAAGFVLKVIPLCTGLSGIY
jgi:hypothetical protein